MAMHLKTADFFCGIGGIRLGFERACDKHGIGHSCVYSCDIAPDACKVYEERFGPPNPMNDITAIDENDFPDFDIALGGFPCQAFSISGKMKGFEDTRGTLFFHLARILKAKQPKAFLFENVKNLVHHDGGKTLARIMEVLEELGYSTSFHQLNSKDFGVPQSRPRVYIVGFKKCGGGFEWPRPTDSTKRLKDILEASVDKKFFLSNKYWDFCKRHRARHEARGNMFGYVVRSPDGVSGTVLCGGMGKERNMIKDVTPADAGPDVNPDGMRMMTPLEWERLQSFPDGWTSSVSDTGRMDLLGNSVTVNAIEAVASSLLAELETPVRTTVTIFD